MRRRPYVALAVAIGTVPAIIVVLVQVLRGANNTDAIFIGYTIRALLLVWAGLVAALVWSVYDERRRERVWRNARVWPDDPRLHSPAAPPPDSPGGQQNNPPSD